MESVEEDMSTWLRRLFNGNLTMQAVEAFVTHVRQIFELFLRVGHIGLMLWDAHAKNFGYRNPGEVLWLDWETEPVGNRPTCNTISNAVTTYFADVQRHSLGQTSWQPAVQVLCSGTIRWWSTHYHNQWVLPSMRDFDNMLDRELQPYAGALKMQLDRPLNASAGVPATDVSEASCLSLPNASGASASNAANVLVPDISEAARPPLPVASNVAVQQATSADYDPSTNSADYDPFGSDWSLLDSAASQINYDEWVYKRKGWMENWVYAITIAVLQGTGDILVRCVSVHPDRIDAKVLANHAGAPAWYCEENTDGDTGLLHLPIHVIRRWKMVPQGQVLATMEDMAVEGAPTSKVPLWLSTTLFKR